MNKTQLNKITNLIDDTIEDAKDAMLRVEDTILRVGAGRGSHHEKAREYWRGVIAGSQLAKNHVGTVFKESSRSTEVKDTGLVVNSGWAVGDPSRVTITVADGKLDVVIEQ